MVLSTEESATSLVAPVNTAKVLFTDSFAVRPEINAVDARQSLNPSGMKSGAIIEPIDAKMLAELSETMFSDQSKLCKNQITMVPIKITVKAL